MRKYFFMLPLLFWAAGGYGQEKSCPFVITADIFIDSITSCQLLDTIKALPFKTYNRKGKMPRFIKKSLKCTEGDFRIANPGHPYNVSDAIGPFGFLLPFRQLMYLGLTKQYLLMAYKKGGIGTSTSTLLVKFEHKKILNMWCWLGISEEVKTAEEIILCLEWYNEIPKHRFAL
ncbi:MULTISPECIES: hypothetical protein [Niastella]|uniref:Uncharacterized protein n=1 Tax=Niastella soli TaxID=2821487 RepID=A0ABS3YL69_9BACT|nr:hypothetical protein [Niastella soli]MBO9198634.1 hypothetical protein [Niastella soli]